MSGKKHKIHYSGYKVHAAYRSAAFRNNVSEIVYITGHKRSVINKKYSEFLNGKIGFVELMKKAVPLDVKPSRKKSRKNISKKRCNQVAKKAVPLFACGRFFEKPPVETVNVYGQIYKIDDRGFIFYFDNDSWRRANLTKCSLNVVRRKFLKKGVAA